MAFSPRAGRGGGHPRSRTSAAKVNLLTVEKTKRNQNSQREIRARRFINVFVIVARLRQPPLMAAGPASASLHGPSDQAACAGDTRLFGPWERSSPLMISWAHHQRAPQPSGAHARPGHHKLHQRRATVRAPFHTSSTARPWGSNCLPRRAADPRSIRRCRRSAVCIARPAPCTRAVSIATGCRLKRMGGCRTWQLGSSLQS